MNDELTDLLPLDRQKKLRRWYFVRLSVVGVILMTLLVGSSAILLLPTYVFLSKSAVEKQARLTSLGSSLSPEKQKELSQRLSALTSKAKILTELTALPSVEITLQAILAVARPGITLSGFTYTPAKSTPKNTPRTLVITGASATRDALRAYQLALQEVPFVSTAVLPVSAYAQSSDIPFAITLTLTP